MAASRLLGEGRVLGLQMHLCGNSKKPLSLNACVEGKLGVNIWCVSCVVSKGLPHT